MRLTGTPSWIKVRRRSASEKINPSAPVPRRELDRCVWAVGGGKGGIGKSFLAANFATVAARSGRRVMLIDCDLGGANLHTCLGVRTGQRVNLSDFLNDRVADLEKAAIDTPIPGLRLILGTLGHTGAAETSREQREALMDAVRKLPADLVILDLAAGTGRSTIDFFLGADEGLLVTTPEPTALENVYSFLRAAFYRRLGRELADSPLREVVREAMDQRNERGIRTPTDLFAEIERIDSTEAARFRGVMQHFRPGLVVNQVRSSDEIKLGFSVQSVSRKYFGVDLDYVGYVNYDDSVWRSMKERRPLVLAYPQSDGSLYIRRIMKKMLGA